MIQVGPLCLQRSLQERQEAQSLVGGVMRSRGWSDARRAPGARADGGLQGQGSHGKRLSWSLQKSLSPATL